MSLNEGEGAVAQLRTRRFLGRRFCFAWTEEQIAQAKGLWADGWSARQIGDKIGTSRNSVIGKLHRLGLTRADKPQDSEFLQRSRAAKEAARVRQTKRERADKDWGLRQRFADKSERLRIGSYGWPTLVPDKPPQLRVPKDAPPPKNLSLLELTEQTCKWACTEDVPYSFCGNDTHGASPPYCLYHSSMSSGPQRPALTDAQLEHRRRLASRMTRQNIKRWAAA